MSRPATPHTPDTARYAMIAAYVASALYAASLAAQALGHSTTPEPLLDLLRTACAVCVLLAWRQRVDGLSYMRGYLDGRAARPPADPEEIRALRAVR